MTWPAARGGSVRRVLSALVAVVLVALGYVALDVYDMAPGVLTRDRPGPATRSTPATSATSAPGAPTGQATGPVPAATLPRVDPAAAPLEVADGSSEQVTRAGLARALAAAVADGRLGSSVGATVRDAVTGAHLLDLHADAPRTPASATKLLTAAAVMSALDADDTFVTSARLGPGRQLFLVAGGDTLLAPGKGSPAKVAGRAGLGDLAADAAKVLAARGMTSVALRLDDTATPGARYAPAWAAVDIDYGLTGPVAGLGLSTTRPQPGRPAPADPALGAAAAFARALEAAGVTVGGTPTRAGTPEGAETLATVRSAPVADVLALALADSDNALTEAVARRAAARAGTGPTFSAVAGWVRSRVAALGIDVRGVRLADTSGLSAGTLVPARVVGDVLAYSAGGEAPALRQVVAQLPVAGLTGTLAERFHTPSSRAAAGLVRAKTGTLTGASALAGTVVDRDGRLLIFAVLADRVPAATGTPGARAALDRFVATLAACGCR